MIPQALKALLLAGINPKRVGQAQGRAHVEAYEIRAHLIRTFDFDGWDQRILANELVFESENAEHKWTACYRAQCELRVRWPGDDGRESVWVEWATGDSQNQPSRADAHDMALKTAESQALKRCAMNLGDQFGLSLYRKGQTTPLVVRTWDMAANAPGATVPRVDEHVQGSVPESDEVEAAPDNHVQSEPPARGQDITNSDARTERIKDLTQQFQTAKSRMRVGEISAQVMKEGLGGALTADGITLGALAEAVLKRVHTTRGAA